MVPWTFFLYVVAVRPVVDEILGSEIPASEMVFIIA